MEINLVYSRKNTEQQRAIGFVRQAVKNLGISATIVECDLVIPRPKVVVNGFDLINDTELPGNSRLSYELIEKALEQTAW